MTCQKIAHDSHYRTFCYIKTNMFYLFDFNFTVNLTIVVQMEFGAGL